MELLPGDSEACTITVTADTDLAGATVAWSLDGGDTWVGATWAGAATYDAKTLTWSRPSQVTLSRSPASAGTVVTRDVYPVLTRVTIGATVLIRPGTARIRLPDVTPPPRQPVPGRGVPGGLAGLDSAGDVIDATNRKAVVTTDARLSDARTPTVHTHAEADVTSLTSDLAAKAATTTLPIRAVGARYRDLTIVVYHVTTLGTFQTDLDYYQEWNYATVTPGDVAGHLAGTSTLPDKPLLVTFDDGYTEQHALAQELNARGMKGVFYVTPGYIDGTTTGASFGATGNPATWAQVQQWLAWGHDIQSHTMTHPDMTTLSAAAVTADFAAAKARIESQVPGTSVWHLAYPFGAWNAAVRSGLVTAGCKTARAVRIANDGGYPGANLGRLAVASTLHDRYALPCAGTGYGDVMQPNFNRALGVDPELVPDAGWEAGGKGWSLGTGWSVDTTEHYAGTRSLKGAQTASTTSSSTTRLIPVGMYCRVVGSVWVKTVGLPGSTLTKVQNQIIKPDGVTIYQTNDVVTVTGNNNAWTQYTFSYTGDYNTGFLKLFCWLQNNASPTGSAWFDALTLRRELLPSPVMLSY